MGFEGRLVGHLARLMAGALLVAVGCDGRGSTFPTCCEPQGSQAVPFAITNKFDFRTGTTNTGSNLEVFSSADVLTLANAANVTQQEGMGIINGVAIGPGGPTVDVGIYAADLAGNSVGKAFYNALGGTPDLFNLLATGETGAFTVFNVPPGETFLWARSGARGNARLITFPGQISVANVNIIPIAPPDVGVSGGVTVTGGGNPTGVLVSLLIGLGPPTGGGLVVPLTIGESRGFWEMPIFLKGDVRCADPVNAQLCTAAPTMGLFLLELFGSSITRSRQELTTDFSQIVNQSGLSFITKDLVAVSSSTIQQAAQAVGATITSGTGVIYGRVMSPQLAGDTTQQNGVITVTDGAGNACGGSVYPTCRAIYRNESGNFSAAVGKTSTNGGLIVINTPTGLLYVSVTATETTTAQPIKKSSRTIILAEPNVTYVRDFFVQAIGSDQATSTLFPYSVQLSGKITEDDGFTPVSGGTVSALGVAGAPTGLCGTAPTPPVVTCTPSDSTGLYSIFASGTTDSLTPLLANSTHLLSVNAANHVPTYNRIATGLSATTSGLITVGTCKVASWYGADCSGFQLPAGKGAILGTVTNMFTGRTADLVSIRVTDLGGREVGEVRYINRSGQASAAPYTFPTGQFLIRNVPIPTGSNNTLVNLTVVSPDDSGSTLVQIFPGGLTIRDMRISKVIPRFVQVSGAVRTLTNTLVPNADEDILAQTNKAKFDSDGSGAFTYPFETFSQFVVKVTKAGHLPTYNDHIRTGLVSLTSVNLYLAPSAEIAALAASAGITQQPGMGIVAGEPTTSDFGVGGTSASGGTAPQSLVAGYFDADDRVDVAVANGDNLALRFGNGDGTFTAGSTYLAGSGALISAVVAADFNADGITDFAVARANTGTLGSVLILLGSKNGLYSEAPGSPITVGSRPVAITVGDVDRNGKPDLVTANYGSDNLTVLLGAGDGRFTVGNGGTAVTVTSPSVQTRPTGIAVGDFSGDSNEDLAVTFEGTQAAVLFYGDGRGTFRNSGPFCVGSTQLVANICTGASPGPSAIVTGDFNRDGRPDLAVANRQSGTVTVLLGDVTSGFKKAAEVCISTTVTCPNAALQPRAIVLADFNFDGRSDLAVASKDNCPTNTTLGAVSVLLMLGNGDGTFSAPQNFCVGKSPSAIVTADFNNDGYSDLAVTNAGDDTISTLTGREIPARDITVGLFGQDGAFVGQLRYFNDAATGLDLSLTKTSKSGRFIAFNVPMTSPLYPGATSSLIMVRATDGVTGNRLVTVNPDGLTFTRVQVITLPPHEVMVSGVTVDPVGGASLSTLVGGVQVEVLHTGLRQTSNSTGGGVLFQLPANSNFLVRLLRKNF